MRSAILFTILLASTTSCGHVSGAAPRTASAQGATYTAHDLRRAYKQAKPDEPGHLDLGYLDSVIADLVAVLGSYPPRFASETDREQAEKDVRGFAGLLEAMAEAPPAQVEVLWRAGLFHSLGHQLDLQGEALRAKERFTEALSMSPDHSSANYHLGAFLAGAGRAQEALPYLQRAKAVGVDAADYSLGMAYVALDDRAMATKSFRAYLERHPGDQRAATLLRHLESGAPIRRVGSTN